MIRKNQKKDDPKRRVVVTGLGVVSSIGIGWEEFWKNLLAGKSGISKISAFDTSNYDRHYAGEVKNFDPAKFIDKRKIPYLGRASQMAIAATKMAIKDANLKLKDIKNGQVGVAIGTTMGESQVMEEMDNKCYSNGKYEIDLGSASKYPASLISYNVSNYFDLTGPSMVFSNACSAGNFSIARSYDLIKDGKVDYMFAGGVDAFSRIAFTGFARLFAIAPKKCQPFDKDRKGMIPGEGAGLLLLETLENAKKRKANIYAEITGYGLSCDAHHMTNPSVEGVASAIRRALENAKFAMTDVDYISAHGTGTKENDKTECEAIHQVFGKFSKNVPISSIKSMLGHTMGAASALESIACCLAIKNEKIPPTINVNKQDSSCKIDCVPNVSRKHRINAALNSSQAFGGNNACVVYAQL